MMHISGSEDTPVFGWLLEGPADRNAPVCCGIPWTAHVRMIIDCVRTTSRQALMSIILVEVFVVCLFLHSNSNFFDSGSSQRLKLVEHTHKPTGNRSDIGASLQVQPLDIPKEDPLSNNWPRSDTLGGHNLTTVAIGCAITSNKIPNVLQTTLRNIKQKFIFFTALLPTFCLTASPGYSYHFYLAYDRDDTFFSKYSFLVMFQKAFYILADERCTTVSALHLHFVQCNHNKKPAWAQNDAMIEAYIDNIDYYYRINDDTLMRTQNWTGRFINTLVGFDPPNLGVVGPTHKGGNKKILTYDFVHRTHVDVFGFYYPRVFTDWFGDGWITTIYKPGRSVKLTDIELRHTMKLGQRYGHHSDRKTFRPRELQRDKILLERLVIPKKNLYKDNII